MSSSPPATVASSPDYASPEWWISCHALGKTDLSRQVPETEHRVQAGVAEPVLPITDALGLDAQDEAKADVFWIHPTMALHPGVANKDSRDSGSAALAFAGQQAAAFNGCCRVYAPFYNQCTFDAEDRAAAEAVAYEDIRQAFVHYLDHWRDDRPLFLAGHSQGAVMVRRLLAEFVVPAPSSLFGRQAAARCVDPSSIVGVYLIGIHVREDHGLPLSLATRPGEARSIVVWNCAAADAEPQHTLVGSIAQKAASEEEKATAGGGGSSKLDMVVHSPLTFQLACATDADSSDSPGIWNLAGGAGAEYHGALGIKSFEDPVLVLYKDVVGAIELKHGLVRITSFGVASEAILQFYRDGRDYHKSDVHMFWGNLRRNAELQLAEFISSEAEGARTSAASSGSESGSVESKSDSQ